MLNKTNQELFKKPLDVFQKVLDVFKICLDEMTNAP
jgi:hypothetical protein